MVIANPKLSLPSDLPYKKRQRPFNPNTSLQQATIRYNEAIRKQYNDVQFAKRYENGYISQNELISVNTVDIAKTVEPDLFTEMSNLNPLPVVRQRKSRKVFICTGNSTSTGEVASFRNSRRHYTSSSPMMIEKGKGDQAGPPPTPDFSPRPTPPVQIDCNNTEMFPHLLSTVGNGQTPCPKVPSPPPLHTQKSAPFFTRSLNKYPSPSQSLEAQAIHEYEPTMDSAHDMIFGNVMGIDYGNYFHGHLWPTPQQSCSNENSLGPTGSSPTPYQFQSLHQTAHPPAPAICGASKSVGFNLPTTTHHHHHLHEGHTSYDSNDIITVSPLTNIGNHTQYPGSSRRSTSVPRPRTGTRKETLKQAAIRCGIIKGNQTVPAIPKRSHCLFPLPLTPVQSDSALSVVEILHPRTLIPTCSSEALVDEDQTMSEISNLKDVPTLSENAIANSPASTEDEPRPMDIITPNEDGDGNGKPLLQIRSVADIRTMDPVNSSASF